MELGFESRVSKEVVFDEVRTYLSESALDISSVDAQRPWGGFFVIDEAVTDQFIRTYFPDKDIRDIKKFGEKLSPKILLVAPQKRLSWQYHDRRAEIWRVVSGPVGVVVSTDDIEKPVRTLQSGEIIEHDPNVRHRLVGLEGWGVIAEIWQHTDPVKPSDEDDIVRVSDDFGR